MTPHAAADRPVLTFLGGAGTVTGSKYLLEGCGRRILVDCGLFQGHRALRERNWQPLPFAPSSLDLVVITHAHLDHTGYLPVLVRDGYKGPVIATSATRDLCAILLPDSGHLMERDAEYATRKGFSRHKPAKPLYTQAEAEACLSAFRPLEFNVEQDIGAGMKVQFLPSGHILGSAFVSIVFDDCRLVFSGDIGRFSSATMVDPAPVREATHLVVESTYGDRIHEASDVEDVLADLVSRTASRGGTVVIPAFAVGRAQSLLFHLSELRRTKRIPELPIYLDSPMAVNASGIFCDHLKEHRLTAAQCHRTCDVATYVRRAEESKALDESVMPAIIVSASGMATGGRVVHHLKHFAPDSRNTILFSGFQAAGTRGARIRAGEREVKIHGEWVPINAEIADLAMLSAHADRNELLRWLGGFATAPRQTFVTHGEAAASGALAETIAERFGWDCIVPEHGQSALLT